MPPKVAVDERPNIVLIMTDQHRGDCLGIDGHPVVQTPYLDQIAAGGVRFRTAYTACPVCAPARRTLMTGQKPVSHGVFTNYDTWLHGPTLPGELARAGYQTHLVGKLHLHPVRKLHGFMSADWADGPSRSNAGDYLRFLRREGVHLPDPAVASGTDVNGWLGRPWHLPEQLHFSNWCADRALEFLGTRDPTVPFFLKVSFHHPHPPCNPPQPYYDRYIAMDLPEPYVGDWARVYDASQRGLPVDSWRISLDPPIMKQFRAAYYGCITHIDDQVGRILFALQSQRIRQNTIVVFLADHGEMLGDHQWLRKRNALEPSARVPMLMEFPHSIGIPPGQVRDEPVELMDVMPTLLDATGVAVPDAVDGQSVLPLLRHASATWRDYVHGETCNIPTLNSGMQYLTDGRGKYIWYPGTGEELLFNLEDDPCELHDLSQDSRYSAEIDTWRLRLVEEMTGRPEGFTDGRQLTPVGGPTASCLPGFEREALPAEFASARPEDWMTTCW